MATDVQAEKQCMIDHIKSEKGFQCFEACLKGLYCEENLSFWKQIEVLHTIAEDDLAALTAHAKLIVDEFLASEAPQSVNVYHPSKNTCMKNYEANKISSTMFDVLQGIPNLIPFFFNWSYFLITYLFSRWCYFSDVSFLGYSLQRKPALQSMFFI